MQNLGLLFVDRDSRGQVHISKEFLKQTKLTYKLHKICVFLQELGLLVPNVLLRKGALHPLLYFIGCIGTRGTHRSCNLLLSLLMWDVNSSLFDFLLYCFSHLYVISPTLHREIIFLHFAHCFNLDFFFLCLFIGFKVD